MIRKSFTKIKRIIFSGLVMSLCTFVFNPTTPANAAMVQESEPNDDWTTADNLPLNTWVKGTMRRKADDRYYRDKDYYKFTIYQAGETSIEIKPDDTNTINSSWDVYLSDSNKHDLCKWSNVHTLKSSKVGWMPGTYYLRVNVWSGTDGDNASDYSPPQAARVLMVAFWLSPYTAGALEESSLPEHRHFAPKTIRRTAVLAGAFHVSFNMRKA